MSGIIREIMDEEDRKIFADLNTPDAWEELKHAIRVYHTLTQGPSEALCLRLLKLPDFLDDFRAGIVNDGEMAELAFVLVNEVGHGVLLKLETYKNRPSLAEVYHRLRACLEWASGVDKITAKRSILHDVSLALAEMSTVTGEQYPSVPK